MSSNVSLALYYNSALTEGLKIKGLRYGFFTGEVAESLASELEKRVMVLDGGMGTMIQKYDLDEAAFRGIHVFLFS